MQAATTRGQVVEVLPAALYRVSFADGKDRLCYIAGKMKMNKIRVLIGDQVEVIIDPYGGRVTNRITRRLPL